MPERMILCHGLSPKGQGEVRSELLGLAKVLGRIVVFEVVELCQAVKKVWLRGCRAGIREPNFTVRLLRQRGCRAQKPERGKK